MRKDTSPVRWKIASKVKFASCVLCFDRACCALVVRVMIFTLGIDTWCDMLEALFCTSEILVACFVSYLPRVFIRHVSRQDEQVSVTVDRWSCFTS